MPLPLPPEQPRVMTATEIWPLNLRLHKDRRALTIMFQTGTSYYLSAEYLRTQSPSAEVQGHTPQQRQLVAGKADVLLTAMEPVGHYAVRLIFSDGHDTGLYSWRYLDELGQEQPVRWPSYLQALAKAGLSR
jgi:DUF971 family protein